MTFLIIALTITILVAGYSGIRYLVKNSDARKELRNQIKSDTSKLKNSVKKRTNSIRKKL
jgi:hypothetical protein